MYVFQSDELFTKLSHFSHAGVGNNKAGFHRSPFTTSYETPEPNNAQYLRVVLLVLLRPLSENIGPSDCTSNIFSDEICFLEYSIQFELFQHSCLVRLSRASANRSKLRRCVKKMNGSILVNGSQRSELVILVSKGKRYGPIMASAPANKENVSPEKDIDCLSDSFQKSLTMNHVDKDGRYFLDLMERESERLMRLCQGTEQEMASKTLPEDGKIF